MELLLGAGSNRLKKIQTSKKDWTDLITLDMNADHKPDVIWDLRNLPLPFHENTFDEIHAYDVLEHLGQQGDYVRFFAEFSEWYRLLRPNGLLCGISPHWSSPWAWGDPGHTRIISPENFVYLSQTEYKKQIGVTPMTDYRFIWKGDFELLHSQMLESQNHSFVLRAHKPVRV